MLQRASLLTFQVVPNLIRLLQEDRLMVSDPAALRFILHDPNIFERSVQQQEIVNMLIGKKTVFYVKGTYISDTSRYRHCSRLHQETTTAAYAVS